MRSAYSPVCPTPATACASFRGACRPPTGARAEPPLAFDPNGPCAASFGYSLFPDRKYFMRRHLREDSRHAIRLERAACHVELVIDESRHEPVPGDLHVWKDLPRICLRVVGLEGPEGHFALRLFVFAAGDVEFAVVDGKLYV